MFEEVGSSYIKFMPPEPLEEQSKTMVNFSIDILAILDVAEVDSIISMQLDAKLSWYN